MQKSKTLKSPEGGRYINTHGVLIVFNAGTFSVAVIRFLYKRCVNYIFALHCIVTTIDRRKMCKLISSQGVDERARVRIIISLCS